MLQQLAEQFQHHHGCPPFAVARAPGRVNLIGEHIDYMGYGVMPMALTQCCCVAVAWQPSSNLDTPSKHVGSATSLQGCQHAQQQQVMHIANVQHQLYPAGQLPLHPDSQLEDGNPGWFKYILAAYKVRWQ
eukprot:GHRQ01025767.1.p2 GENE.GHRQ01025767.1~~GHRQ01025767.1.p2  ORF type:complete len:131 (+),score=28.18 GHRQ01025767.1:704-1096(+)